MQAPSIMRRLGASLYEFTLLFGIYFITGALVQVLYQLVGQVAPTWAIQFVIFIAFGLYFSHSWQKAGQTLAQRTWHIKVLNSTGQLPTAVQAWLRYGLAYLGVLPALLLTFAHFSRDNLSGFFAQTIILIIINWLALLGTSFMNPQRRALHEVISGTRSVLYYIK